MRSLPGVLEAFGGFWESDAARHERCASAWRSVSVRNDNEPRPSRVCLGVLGLQSSLGARLQPCPARSGRHLCVSGVLRWRRMFTARWLGIGLVSIVACGRDPALEGAPNATTLAPGGGVCCPIDYTIACTQHGYFGGWRRTGAECAKETWFDGCPIHRERIDEHGCRIAEVTPVCDDGWHCLATRFDVRSSDATTASDLDARPVDTGSLDAAVLTDSADACSHDECSR